MGASWEARVRTLPSGPETVAPPSSVAVLHHRTPSVEWSVERPTGGHMLHLALAQCVFNNVVRLAGERGIALGDASVTVDGEFNDDATASMGIVCAIELSGNAPGSALEQVGRDAYADSSVVAILQRGGPVELASVRVVPDTSTPR